MRLIVLFLALLAGATASNPFAALRWRLLGEEQPPQQTLLAVNYDARMYAKMFDNTTYTPSATDHYTYPGPLPFRTPEDVAREVFATSMDGVVQTYEDGYAGGLADCEDDEDTSPPADGAYKDGYVDGYARCFADRRMRLQDSGHHSSCPLPVSPVEKVKNITMFGVSGVSTGTFHYVTIGAAMPLKMANSKAKKKIGINHVTTDHQHTATESAISLVLGPGTVASFRTTSSFPGYGSWAAAYQDLVTDGVIIRERGFRVIKYFGKVRDHHSADKRISVTIYMIVKGRYKGMVAKWTFALPFPCTEQSFEWIFDCHKVGEPADSEFPPPYYYPTPIANLTDYALFPANKNCIPV